MYTTEEIEKVVNIDLYDYAVANLNAKREGNWARLRENRSVCFKRGSSRYMDFSKSGKESSGNLIDLLCTYYGETFKSVMETRLDSKVQYTLKKEAKYESHFILPEIDTKTAETMAYLVKTRKIPVELVQRLINEELIYQGINSVNGKAYRNCVFVNESKSYYELHGTYSFGKSFHGNGRKAIDEYWSFKTAVGIATVYICESAIDAMSLAALRQMYKENALCVSIGGVGNYKTIERLIEKYGCKCVLAVDNDKAGQECRERYSQLRSIVSKHKDWNEDLVKEM